MWPSQMKAPVRAGAQCARRFLLKAGTHWGKPSLPRLNRSVLTADVD